MSKAPISGDPDRRPNPTPDKTRRDDSLRPLVAALRRLLEAAGPPALPFLRDCGAFGSDAIACGVLILGPDIEYPAHSHEAEELYLPLAGHAWWRSVRSDWRLRAPGAWIHHPSWTTHAMRTRAEPLLAAYVWRAGDLTAKSRIDG